MIHYKRGRKEQKKTPHFIIQLLLLFYCQMFKTYSNIKSIMTNTNTSRVEDFPNHHIGPRRHEAKAMLQTLGYNVSNYQIEMITLISTNFCHHL